MPQAFDEATFQVDHIRAGKHEGATVAENLAWACFPCNNQKGPNVAGYSETDEIHPLFNPRKDHWNDHFEWDGPELVGKTATGQATINVLYINLPDRVALRRELIVEGVFLPQHD
jgi:5-methylcytosine-specific restriction endonuclease McrA